MLILVIVSQLLTISMPQARALALRTLMFFIPLHVTHTSVFTKQ